MAKKVQLQDSSGNNAYPVTSSAIVGMSDGSGSLDSHLGKITTEYNVSVFYPTGGTGGSNKYTLETAIAKIPTNLRNVGVKCSFLDDAGELETWEYQGDTFTKTGSWSEVGKRKFLELTGEIYDINLINFFQKGKASIIIGNEGAIASDIQLSNVDGFICLKLFCKGGDEFILTGQCISVNARAYVFLSDDNTILLKSAQNELLDETHIIAPENAAIVYFCFSSESAERLERVNPKFKSFDNELQDLQNSMTEIVITDEGDSEQIYSASMLTGTYISGSDTIITGSRNWSVEFPVKKGAKYILNSADVGNQTLFRLAGLDNSNKLVKILDKNDSPVEEYSFICDGTYTNALWMLSNAQAITGTPSILEFAGYKQELNPNIKIPDSNFEEINKTIDGLEESINDIIITDEGSPKQIYDSSFLSVIYITPDWTLGTASRNWSIRFPTKSGGKYVLNSNNVTNQTLCRITGLKNGEISRQFVMEDSSFKEFSFICDGTFDEILWMLSNAYSIEGEPSIIEYDGYKQELNPNIQLPSAIYDDIYNRLDNYVPKSNVIYAYADQSAAGSQEDNGTNIFIGYDENNVNSIQRAINSIPSDTNEQWYIYTIGEFNVTSFDYFASEDPLHDQSSEDYMCFVALVAKRNIHILGVGNRDTKIICNMPSSGFPTPVSNLHPLLIKQTRNCSFHNFYIYGKNVRYTVHINGTTESVSERLWFDNIEFDSGTNDGEAAESWPYGSQNIGIDIAPNMNLRFTNCINPLLRGHFSSQGWGKHYIEFEGCHFYGDATNVIPSENIPSKNCFVEYNFVGNKFYGVSTFINGTLKENSVRMKISGFGNGILYIPKPTEYFNEITDIAQIYKTNNTIYNGNLVDRYGNLANGRIEAVAVFDSDGDKVVCAKHIMYDIGNVTLAEDYTPQNGDYCIAGNGKLSKSDYPTNSYIYSRTGNKYLIIE